MCSPEAEFSYIVIAEPNAPTLKSSTRQFLYLTDAQRDDIDSSTTLLLRDLSSNIQSLSQAETLRQQTETILLQKKYGKRNGLLWRWAAGDEPESEALKSAEQLEKEGRAYTLKTVRESVLWYLGRQLQQATERQREMVEKRISREREKEKSILHKISGERKGMVKPKLNGANHYHSTNQVGQGSNDPSYSAAQPYNPATAPHDAESIEAQLTPDQLQLFAQENSTLLNHYTDQLGKIQSAEKSLLEVLSLQNTLISHLSTQGEMIEQLVTDAVETDENVRKGNRELERATERRSTARTVFFASIGLCGFLIGWDLVF
ncbi:putative snare protein [Phaeomoniella chlamydospora]|uniref:Putative snare protein n=1 Tax=Phaeomoniella chlamydospora TaxID=158046 RepID=A0A0G2EQ96_PHACM|nr:putative snare protein [Phaeomoniella chlamydospora]